MALPVAVRRPGPCDIPPDMGLWLPRFLPPSLSSVQTLAHTKPHSFENYSYRNIPIMALPVAVRRPGPCDIPPDMGLWLPRFLPPSLSSVQTLAHTKPHSFEYYSYRNIPSMALPVAVRRPGPCDIPPDMGL